MLKVVEIKFACEEEFNAKLEVQNALADHLNQVTKKAKGVTSYVVSELSLKELQATAKFDLLTEMDKLTEALNRLRIEGNLTS